jgi:hypothetical protein
MSRRSSSLMPATVPASTKLVEGVGTDPRRSSWPPPCLALASLVTRRPASSSPRDTDQPTRSVGLHRHPTPSPTRHRSLSSDRDADRGPPQSRHRALGTLGRQVMSSQREWASSATMRNHRLAKPAQPVIVHHRSASAGAVPRRRYLPRQDNLVKLGTTQSWLLEGAHRRPTFLRLRWPLPSRRGRGRTSPDWMTLGDTSVG